MNRRTVLLSGAAALQASPSIRVVLIRQADSPHLDIYRKALKAAAGVREVVEAGPRDHARVGDAALAVVAMPSALAPEAIAASLEAGRHVLAEKPACTGAAQFERLAALAEKRGRNLMLAFATRSHAAVLRAAGLIRAGWIGKPYAAEMRFIADQTRLAARAYQESWFAKKAMAGGGHLIWLGIHYIDLAQFLTGQRIDRVAALAGNVGGQPVEVEDAEVVSFHASGGMLGALTGGYLLESGYHNEVSLWGADGWLRFNPGGSSIEWQSKKSGAPAGVQRTEVKPVDAYQAFVQGAVDCARGAAPPPVTAAECLHTLRVVFACYRSAETGAAQNVA
jgi:predicted dehydrogenase